VAKLSHSFFLRQFFAAIRLFTPTSPAESMQKETPSDTTLAADIRRGESVAETVIYEKYAARVYYLALSELRSREDAEDVRVESFLRVIKALRNGQLRSPEALPGFILGTAKNVVREKIRQRRKEERIAQADNEPGDPFFIDPWVKQAIKQVIRRLKPREQAFLVMYFYQELPPDQIAARLNLKPERLRLIKSRALKHFREVYSRLVKN